MEKAKAFGVTGDPDCGICLVWTTSHSRAKGMVFGRFYGTECCAYTEITCRRYTQFDGMRPEGYCSGDEPTIADCRMMRSDGWYEIEGDSDSCDRCELYVWESIPESKLDENGLCAECAATQTREAGE